MTANALTTRQRTPGTWWLTGVRLAAALVLLWVLGSAVLIVFSAPSAARLPVGTLALGIALYAACHLVRIARLALLVGNARLSLRRLAAFHLYTSGVGMATPWRLGDLYRAIELGRMLHRVPIGPTLETPPALSLGITFVWIERLLDAALLSPVLLVLLVWRAAQEPNATPADYTTVAGVTFLFVVLSVLIVTLLPDNLRRVGTYLIRRHEKSWTVPLLQSIDEIRTTIRRVPQLLAGRIPSLLVMSVLIWLFELLSLTAMLSAFETQVNPVEQLLGFLSRSTSGESLSHLRLMPSTGGFMYALSTQVPLAFFATLSGIYYLRRAFGWKTA